MLPLAGEWTLDTFSQHLETLPLFEHEPERHAYLDYRRWAFESAALDLALRQAGSLARRRGRARAAAGHLRRVLRTRGAAFDRAPPRVPRALPDAPLQARREHPTGRTRSVAELADARLRRLDRPQGPVHAARSSTTLPTRSSTDGSIEAFPDAWLEDPALTPETEPLLEPHADRVTWDAVDPLGRRHRGAALAAAHRERQAVPVRHGRAALRRLRLLRPAAGSAPTAAASSSWRSAAARSSCSPRSSTRTRRTTSRPGGYNATEPATGLPASPLTVAPRATGFLAVYQDVGPADRGLTAEG